MLSLFPPQFLQHNPYGVGVQAWYNEACTKTGRCITRQDQKAMTDGSRTQRTVRTDEF